MHEIQHWVQQTEGFAEGGNEKSAVNAIMDTFEAEEIIGEIRTAIQAKLEKINAKQELFYKVVANIPDVISRIEGIQKNKKAQNKMKTLNLFVSLFFYVIFGCSKKLYFVYLL